MLKAGEVYENLVTGERAVIRLGTDTTGGELLVVDVYVQPGGAVIGEHFHPEMEERFMILRGRVGFRLAGRVAIAEPGMELIASPGTPHDWWNAGPEEALIRMEMRPAARFEAMIRNTFGLAQDGKVNKHGMPSLLQLALFAREFDDVMQFTWPYRIVQRLLFGLLTPLARLLGYRGSYPEYLTGKPSRTVSAEPFTRSDPFARTCCITTCAVGAAYERQMAVDSASNLPSREESLKTTIQSASLLSLYRVSSL